MMTEEVVDTAMTVEEGEEEDHILTTQETIPTIAAVATVVERIDANVEEVTIAQILKTASRGVDPDTEKIENPEGTEIAVTLRRAVWSQERNSYLNQDPNPPKAWPRKSRRANKTKP